MQLFLKGMIFDTETILYFNFLPILALSLPFRFTFSRIYHIAVKSFILLVNILLVVVDLSDSLYYQHSGSRATIDLIATAYNANFFQLLPTYVKAHWYVLFALLIVISFIVFLYPRTDKIESSAPLPRQSFLCAMLLPMLVLMNAASLYTDVGFGIKPHNVFSLVHLVSTEHIPIVINSPWSMLQSAPNSRLPVVHYFPDDEVNRLCCPIVDFKKDEPFKKMNVVIIILEGFSKSFLSDQEDRIPCAPFLNALVKSSLTFDLTIANSRRTHLAVPAIISGIPSLMDQAFIYSNYVTNNIPSVASLLRSKGYYTAFLHGGTNGILHLDSYARTAGFESYLGMNEYPEKGDFDGFWGIYDEPYLQYAAKMMDSFRQPFFASVLTLSSHQPYNLPPGKEKVFCRQKSKLGNTIEYADYALRRFFETASRMSWYKNTLFVITADHTEEVKGVPYDVVHYSIPILFYKPGSALHANRNITCQQIDILPSVLDFLNYDEPFFAFGHSVFSDKGDSSAVNYLNGVYSLVSGDYLLLASREKHIGFYNYVKDRKLAVNLISDGRYLKKQHEMGEKLKAVIQNFNSRMNLNLFPQPVRRY